MVTICISDEAEEFRIEIAGRFAGTAVNDAATAWKAALSVNTPRRISVDITRMTGFDRAGYTLLREIYSHGTHIAAATPRSLRLFTQISSSRPFAGSFEEDAPRDSRRGAATQLLTDQPKAIASAK